MITAMRKNVKTLLLLVRTLEAFHMGPFQRPQEYILPVMSAGWSVSQSVGVGWSRSVFCFLAYTGSFCITAPAQMIGKTFSSQPPAHPHATSVAVHP